MHYEYRMRQKIYQSKAQDASNIKYIGSILKHGSPEFYVHYVPFMH